jgi:pimeloyl-ACP methyl ester carboxylesterase
MGANVGMVFAGSYPEFIRKLVLIEGFGPFSLPPETAAVAMRTALESERSMVERRIKGPKEYATLDAAIDTKMKKLQQYPGHPQSISREAAKLIISRYCALVQGAAHPSVPKESG